MSKMEKFKSDISTTVAAWLRQGAKELGQAIVPAFPDSIRPVEEIGLPGNPTSQQVSLSMGLYGPRTPDRQPEIEKE